MNKKKLFTLLVNFADKYAVIFMWLVLTITLSFLSPVFFTTRNIFAILRQVSIIGLLAIGEMVVILLGEIDVSVGSTLAFIGVVLAIMLKAGVPIWLAILGALILGMVIGFIIGTVITRLKAPSFVVTLAMMSIARGMTLVVTKGYPVSMLPEGFRQIAASHILGVPIPVIILVFATVTAGILLGKTKLGRHFYAIGGNTAWNANVPLVTYDRTVKSDKILAHVGHDNYGGGKLVGEWMAKQLKGKGLVLVIQGWAGCGASRPRVAGFKEVMAKYPKIRVLVQDAYLSRERAKDVMENVLTAHIKVDGVFSITEDMMLGALPVLEEQKVRPKIISYDTHIEIIKAIKDKRMDACFEQYPDEQVRTALRTLVKYIREGVKPEVKEIYLPGKIIDSNNFSDAEIWDEIKDKI